MGSIDWMLGLKSLLLGLGSVFAVLVLLIVFISIMGKFVQGSEKKQKSPKKAEKPAVKPSVEDDEDEVVAVISAAIACMAQREGKKFKIRSYKRV